MKSNLRMHSLSLHTTHSPPACTDLVGPLRLVPFLRYTHPWNLSGVDICGDGVIRQAEGGLSPYYPPWSGSPSLATSKGSSPSTTVQSPQPARSRSVSAPLCHRAPPPPSKLGRSDSSSSGDSSGGEVVETPPRWERRATLSDGRPEVGLSC